MKEFPGQCRFLTLRSQRQADDNMKHPLETLMSAASILLLALLSCLLLPAPMMTLALAKKLIEIFHLLDLSQLYTILFCIWFLALGCVEYLALRFIWRRWFSIER
jgi:hypothetical protein